MNRQTANKGKCFSSDWFYSLHKITVKYESVKMTNRKINPVLFNFWIIVPVCKLKSIFIGHTCRCGPCNWTLLYWVVPGCGKMQLDGA